MATTTTYRTDSYPCRVYTALLTQTGGDDPNVISSGAVTAGVTYEIVVSLLIGFWDFSNVGGPVYPETYTFVATASDVPNSWAGVDDLNYNNGAPVVTVLENTIGNIWFTYNDVGNYRIFSDGLFTENKTTFSIILMGDELSNGYLCKGYIGEPNSCSIVTGDILTPYDSVLNWKTPIEIRVYN